MQTFLTWDNYFFTFLFLNLCEKKKSKPVGYILLYKNTVFANWGKYEVSCNFCLVLSIDF